MASLGFNYREPHAAMPPEIIIATPDQIRAHVAVAVHEALTNQLPQLVRQATRKPYLTRSDIKGLTGFSDRKLQHLRDTRQLPFVQHGRKILYPTEEVYRFLRDLKVKPRETGSEEHRG